VRLVKDRLRLGSLPLMNIAWGPPLHAHMYPLDAGTGRRGVRLSDLRKSIGGMRKYTDSSLRALGSKAKLKLLSELPDSHKLAETLDKALKIKTSITAAAWRCWIRFSMTPWGIFILYRLPLLLQMPLDVLFFYCPVQ
ncbi:hypothetical protein FOZ62_015429, partial [Perkinsus olseni]